MDLQGSLTENTSRLGTIPPTCPYTLENWLARSTMNVESKRARFRALHESGCFVIPNPWDVGSAKRLERMGFQALATTSSGSAWSLGREDGQLSRDEALAHFRQLNAATDLPINADFEAGFADNTRELARNVLLAIETGVAGLSIEDFNNGRLYEVGEATERIAVAKEAIRSAGTAVLLVARAEGFIRGKPDLDDTIKRLEAYSAAGGDCLYAPGVGAIDAVEQLVKAVAPKPLNVLLLGPTFSVPQLAEAGVRRVSVGGALAAAAWAGFEHAARMLRDEGTMPPRDL
jgi:2-methylisocitrate lyase-like PEP mutase family enzyme